MNKNRTNYLLLTGAGFSKNFGLPLAIEIWGQLFNNKHVKQNKRINNAFKKYTYYEEIYDHIRRNADEEMKVAHKLFKDYFNSMDLISANYLLNSNRNINLEALRQFLSRFSGKRNGFFTLNQDIFIERLFLNYPFVKLETPKVPSLKELYERNKASLPSTSWGAFNQFSPYETLIWESQNERREYYFSKKVNYYKLHGSCNWKTKNKDIFIIGKNKDVLINEYPLLKEYFDSFIQILKKGETRICSIGYSFNDAHINDIILNESKLKIFVISPSSPDSFIEQMKEESQRNIWRDKIEYYYQGDLSSLFPISGTSKIYDHFRQEFWGDNDS